MHPLPARPLRVRGLTMSTKKKASTYTPAGLRLLRGVQRLDDVVALRDIVTAARKRLELLRKRAWEESCARKWEEAKTWEPGTEVWCAMGGVAIGGTIQRGWHAVVEHVQPRAKRVWVRDDNGKSVWFSSNGLVRWAIVTEKPEVTADHEVLARIGKRVGKMIERDA